MARSSFYYKNRRSGDDENLVAQIKIIFENNGKNYGARKIKVELEKQGYQASRRTISRIMSNKGLKSSYTKSSKKPLITRAVKTEHPNILDQKFDDREILEVIASDTTYLKINGKWHYLCIMLDLCGRYLEGFAASHTKEATLTRSAFFSMKCDFRDISMFHTDRGCEFVNKLVDNILVAFEIKRSTSGKGNAQDNAVAEAMFKIIKTEFIKNQTFKNLDDFRTEFAKWADWYNNVRTHSSLGYLTPAEFRNRKNDKKVEESLKKCVS